MVDERKNPSRQQPSSYYLRRRSKRVVSIRKTTSDQNGRRHRDNLPAIIDSDGSKWWYQNGQRHRYTENNDLPAVIWADAKRGFNTENDNLNI